MAEHTTEQQIPQTRAIARALIPACCASCAHLNTFGLGERCGYVGETWRWDICEQYARRADCG